MLSHLIKKIFYVYFINTYKGIKVITILGSLHHNKFKLTCTIIENLTNILSLSILISQWRLPWYELTLLSNFHHITSGERSQLLQRVVLGQRQRGEQLRHLPGRGGGHAARRHRAVHRPHQMGNLTGKNIYNLHKNISRADRTFLAISDWASLSLAVVTGMEATARQSLDTAGLSFSSW